MAGTSIWETAFTQEVCELRTVSSADSTGCGRRHSPWTKIGVENIGVSEGESEGYS